MITPTSQPIAFPLIPRFLIPIPTTTPAASRPRGIDTPSDDASGRETR